MQAPKRQGPPRVSLFDCYLGVGESGLQGKRSLSDPAELLGLLDHFGIEEALVYDMQEVETARFGDAEFLLRLCAASPRLHPSVAMAPPGTGELPPPDEWVAGLVARGVKAVRAWPEWHRFDLLPYCVGPLLEVLEARRVPLLASYFSPAPSASPWGHVPNWDHIHRTAEAFPALPLVLTHTGMLENRRLLPLLHRCPNVHCDITGTAGGFIEQVCRELGPERLFFTCEFPHYDPGLLVPWVKYADVDERAARLIAGDNLRRLLREVR